MKRRRRRHLKKALIITAVVLAVYLFAIMPGSRSREIAQPFSGWMYAHRGLYDNESDHPENSMAAFELAADSGYGIEMDVRLTKDGIPVIFHDDSMKRMVRNDRNKKVKGKISDYTFSQLRSFHLKGSSQSIPSLDEFLKEIDGCVPVIVEYKVDDDTDIAQLCSACDERLRSYEGHYCIQSFSPWVLMWYRVHHSEVMRGQLSGKTSVRNNMSLSNIVEENVLLNFLTRPDFISYNEKYYKNPSRQICRNVFNTVSVGWTIRNQEQLELRRGDFDLFIFDGFTPSAEETF